MNNMAFSASCRGKAADIPVEDFLNLKFPLLDKGCIETVFGFVEQTPLYGGRIFEAPEFSDADIDYLYRHNTGLKLPLTNHFVSREEYESNQWLLDKYHRKGNSVVLVNDELATWIRADFPDYEIEASVIKNIGTQTLIDRYLDTYEIIVLPMTLCTEYSLLAELHPKNKLRLFTNAGCAYNCPARTCYKSISKINKLPADEGFDLFNCSQQKLRRSRLGFMDFDIDRLYSLGYRKFKVLRQFGSKGSGY